MPNSGTCDAQMASFNNAKNVANAAKNTIDTTKATYYTCLDAGERGEKMMAEVGPDMARIQAEAETVDTMSKFILKQLARESGASNSLNVLSDLAVDTAATLEKEIEEMKSSIRKERRRFLDADPSATTAVAGLWFTQQPDNQMIIIFLSCFGSFLLIAGLLVIYGYIPFYLVENAEFSQRLMVVGIFWLATLFITYVGFFTFT